MSSSNIDLYTNVQDSFPRSSALTGTVSSVNIGKKLVGTGTAFLTEVKKGDWIYVKAQNAFRKVEWVYDDTNLSIESPFAVALSGASIHVTPDSRAIELTIIPVTAVATINGRAVAADVPIKFETGGKGWRNAAGSFVGPIDIDTTTNTSTAQVSWQE